MTRDAPELEKMMKFIISRNAMLTVANCSFAVSMGMSAEPGIVLMMLTIFGSQSVSVVLKAVKQLLSQSVKTKC